VASFLSEIYLEQPQEGINVEEVQQISGDYLLGEFVKQVIRGIVRHQTKRDGWSRSRSPNMAVKIEMTECGSWVK